MGTPIIMDIEEAYVYVKHFGEMEGTDDLFQILQLMESNWDDLDNIDRNAYKLIKREIKSWVKNA